MKLASQPGLTSWQCCCQLFSSSACVCRPPVVGVLGCMAERLKVQLLDSDKLVDLVAGPDAYRDIPRLLDTIEVGSLLVEPTMPV